MPYICVQIETTGTAYYKRRAHKWGGWGAVVIVILAYTIGAGKQVASAAPAHSRISIGR